MACSKTAVSLASCSRMRSASSVSYATVCEASAEIGNLLSVVDQDAPCRADVVVPPVPARSSEWSGSSL